MSPDPKLQQLKRGSGGPLKSANHDLDGLIKELDAFDHRNFRDADGNFKFPEKGTQDYTIGSIISSSERLKTVLIADLRTSSAFHVTNSGIFDTNSLVNSARNSLSEQALSVFGEDILQEFDASGKCLAFSLPTASGFHAMRAAERVLKKYLMKFKNEAEVRKLKTWHALIAKLESVEGEMKPPSELISLFKQIKDVYRNPIIHPDRNLSPDEALILFHSAIAALSRCACEMERDVDGLAKNSLGKIFGIPPGPLEARLAKETK